MSSFAWLDFAESDRKRALDVIDLFREKGTVDELGIGTVRDAIADILFPGTSTIMTRARYYLFVPWTYLRMEAKKVPSSEIALKARADEIKVIKALVAAGESKGVIGIDAGDSLKRLPSEIYWQGLAILGIRRSGLSRANYHRALDRFYRDGGQSIRGEDGHVIVGGIRRNWDSGLPKAPEGFPGEASLALTEEEAVYLRERIVQSAPSSVFAYMANHPVDVSEVDVPWEHPRAAQMPPKPKADLAYAENFSLVMHGAALTFNLMLAEKSGDDVREGGYTDSLAEWASKVEDYGDRLAAWDRTAFWLWVTHQGARIPTQTKAFAEEWISRVLKLGPAAISKNESVRSLIRIREINLKGELARLKSQRALENWGGASSAEPLDFRWTRPTRAMLEDLRQAEGS
jgi:hypothetical protein